MDEKLLWERPGTGALYFEGSSRELASVGAFSKWCEAHSAGKCCSKATLSKVEIVPWRRNTKVKVHCPNCGMTMSAEKDLIVKALGKTK